MKGCIQTSGGFAGRPRRQAAAPHAPRELLLIDRRQAANHRQTRQAHTQETAEDYVEVIADLLHAYGEARAVDIARRLGVTHVTVTKTVTRLVKAGLLSNRPYRAIFLTEAGLRLANAVRRRHRIVVDFLRAIGVSEKVARTDAEGIEHHVSAETLVAFERVAHRPASSRRPSKR